jgi:metal-dependent amidase/aminoacylase/carboxypeptidase family protein
MTNFGPKNRTQPQLDIVTLRPDFHQNPELGFHEERTGAKVAQYLRALGLDVRSRVLLIGLGGCHRSGDLCTDYGEKGRCVIPLHATT